MADREEERGLHNTERAMGKLRFFIFMGAKR